MLSKYLNYDLWISTIRPLHLTNAKDDESALLFILLLQMLLALVYICIGSIKFRYLTYVQSVTQQARGQGLIRHYYIVLFRRTWAKSK